MQRGRQTSAAVVFVMHCHRLAHQKQPRLGKAAGECCTQSDGVPQLLQNEPASTQAEKKSVRGRHWLVRRQKAHCVAVAAWALQLYTSVPHMLQLLDQPGQTNAALVRVRHWLVFQQ